MPPLFRIRNGKDEGAAKVAGYCVGCGTCAEICPADAISMKKGRPVVVYPEECFHCGSCLVDCPAHAISYRIPLPMLLPVYPRDFFE